MKLWFKHDAHFHEHPKCLRLRRLAGKKADSAEVGWWRILAAARRMDDWTFEDEEHLKEAAGRYHAFVPLYREVALLDGLTIHNADEYQGPMSGAERVAKHRASNAPSVTPVTDQTDKTREEQKRETPRDPADVYWQLVGKYPVDNALAWIDKLTTQYGPEPTIQAIAKAHLEDRSPHTLIGRAQDHLAAGARQLDLQERAAEKRRLAEKRAVPRVEEPWKAEYRAAIERQYRGDAA